MAKRLIHLAGLSCIFLAISCARPDINLINKDLGLKIPATYTLVKADSDPFGLGADADQIFIFKFDSSASQQLELAIRSTPVYNAADVKQFDGFSAGKKLEILAELAKNNLTAYWIRSGATYWFDGDSLFLNTHDNIISQLYSNKINLPNRERKGQGYEESGMPLYTVRAKFDPQKRTLYYRYIHT